MYFLEPKNLARNIQHGYDNQLFLPSFLARKQLDVFFFKGEGDVLPFKHPKLIWVLSPRHSDMRHMFLKQIFVKPVFWVITFSFHPWNCLEHPDFEKVKQAYSDEKMVGKPIMNECLGSQSVSKITKKTHPRKCVFHQNATRLFLRVFFCYKNFMSPYVYIT